MNRGQRTEMKAATHFRQGRGISMSRRVASQVIQNLFLPFGKSHDCSDSTSYTLDPSKKRSEGDSTSAQDRRESRRIQSMLLRAGTRNTMPTVTAKMPADNILRAAGTPSRTARVPTAGPLKTWRPNVDRL